MLESNPINITYQPFKYPPDYALAKIHQNSSMPGKAKQTNQKCPCCHEKLKTPFKSWWDRSIEKDFKRFGGAVIGYFWLIKIYLLAALAIIITYGGYLQYLTNYYCSISVESGRCAKLYGLWVVTNSDLQILIKQQNDIQTLTRFSTLRAILLLILLTVNVLSIYVIKWFKVRYPDKINVVNFSLLFKNIKYGQLDDFIQRLKVEFGPFQIREAFTIQKAQPFYSHYQQKLQVYYACKIEQNAQKLKKLKEKLKYLDSLCSQQQEMQANKVSRAIIVFEDLQIKQKILQNYKISKMKVLKMFFSNQYQAQFRMYCQQAPKPQQIIWKNIGTIERQGFKAKILSVIYFILITSFFVGFLYFFVDFAYLQWIAQPYNTILTTLVIIFIVFLGITFRMLMQKLSEMRFPNTYTGKAIFVVVTTVVFHFIFYIFIPSLYLFLHKQLRGEILSLISSQAISFIVIQIILSAIDLMYCSWNRKKAQIQDQDRPIGCQKILHQKMQYPRYPIEFKLYVLFKIWSFITFFAFQVPLILFLIFAVLVFLYVKEKKNIYHHYRMQSIDIQVQFRFLKIYSNIFSLYLLINFLSMQSDLYQMIIGGAATLLAMFIQTFYFLSQNRQPSSDSFVPLKLSSFQNIDSFKNRYQKFVREARDNNVDLQIEQYLLKSKKEAQQKKPVQQIKQNLLK